MKNLQDENRRSENMIYAGAWIVMLALYILNNSLTRVNAGHPWIDTGTLISLGMSFLPAFVLFLINNYLLIPRLVFHNKYTRYMVYCLLAVVVIWGIQASLIFSDIMRVHPPRQIPPDKLPPQLIPMPVFVALIYDLLIVGANLAIALIFQRIKERFEKERLLKANAEEQLSNLRAQINPHFYMNMLNNIHGMIEINPEKAQEMVIEMSHLMRYMLYDCTNERISLTSEIKMIQIYLNLMRQRFPEDKVDINVSLPTETESAGVMIAPLLFIVFIENSFKHGISYCQKSFVDVRLEIKDGKVIFLCSNSVPRNSKKATKEGIGLQNVQQRLSIIYGDNSLLKITESETTYTVNLTLPTYETKDCSN